MINQTRSIESILKIFGKLCCMLLTLPAMGQSTFSDSTHKWVNGVWYDLEKPKDGYGYYMEGGKKRVNFPNSGSVYLGASIIPILLRQYLQVELNFQAGVFLSNRTFLQFNFGSQYVGSNINKLEERFDEKVDNYTLSVNYMPTYEFPFYVGVFASHQDLVHTYNWRKTCSGFVFSSCNQFGDEVSYRYQTMGALVGMKVPIASQLKDGRIYLNTWVGTGIKHYKGEWVFDESQFYLEHKLGQHLFYGLTLNYQWAPRWFLRQERAKGRYIIPGYPGRK